MVETDADVLLLLLNCCCCQCESDLSLAIDAVNVIVEAAAVELTMRRTITAAMW